MNNNKWILCSERLPEEKVYVLLISKGWENDHNNMYIGCRQDKAHEADPEGKRNFWGISTEESDWLIWGWSYFIKPEVIAWMPLPEPYNDRN